MDSSATEQVSTGSEDSVLVARTRRGDQEAFSLLYDRYSRLVYSVALRVLRSAAMAEDVLHDIFLQLWRVPEQFDAARGNLPAWLAVVARHRAIDRVRRQKVCLDLDDVMLISPNDLDSGVERSRMIEKVRELLKTIPESQRHALELAFFEGKTHAEIAEITREPLGTIKTRIRSALLTIRKALTA
jgi:RNA polymerase sigma-70 factor (ECF subfamily)